MQYSLSDDSLINDFESLGTNQPITCLTITKDSKYVLVGFHDGQLVELTLFNYTKKNFGHIHNSAIFSMKVDSVYLYTSSYDKSVKKFRLKNEVHEHDFKDIHHNFIASIGLC